MKRLLAATLLLFFLQGSSQIISAQTLDEANTLRGLRGVEVIIEVLGLTDLRTFLSSFNHSAR